MDLISSPGLQEGEAMAVTGQETYWTGEDLVNSVLDQAWKHA